MRSTYFRLFLIAALVSLVSCQPQTVDDVVAEPVTPLSEYFGHWSFDIDGTGVGWLGVRQEDGYIDADLLWRGGSVSPVANVFYTEDGVLYVTRIANRRRPAGEGETPRMHTVTNVLKAKADGERITGYLLSPRLDGIGIDSSFIDGVKLPEVPPAPDLSALQFGEPVELFNGKDLTGWRLTNENQVNGFKAIDGVLVNDVAQEPGAPRIRFGNLRTEQEFEDFNLTLEVNIPAGSNSGVYLRGIYEVQVLDSYGREPNSHNMGALYSRITPSVAAERPAGTWQTMDMTLVDRHLTVVLNGTTIIDNQPVLGPTGGALHSDVFAPGPIYLQGDHGVVSFRNFVLTPIIK